MSDAKEKPESGIKRRGFASLSLERRRELASMGGKAVPAEKRSFSDKAKAAAAGAIGGKNTPDATRSFSLNRELAREAGRKGGSSTSEAKRANAAKGGQANAERLRNAKTLRDPDKKRSAPESKAGT